jgi:phosphoglycerate-specific signal transduction histidine kinase
MNAPERGTAIRLADMLIVEECCNCHVRFAMPEGLSDRAQGDSQIWFWCPNGHKQHYTEGELQRAQRDLREAQQRATRNREWAQSERERANRVERSRTALRGALTRVRNRIATGVCPCCRRSFGNLARHMATQHPGYAGAEVG